MGKKGKTNKLLQGLVWVKINEKIIRERERERENRAGA